MTDEELQAKALPLLQELVRRDMLIAAIKVPSPTGHPGITTCSQIVQVVPNGLTLDCWLEDDTQQLSKSAEEFLASHKR
jgi:hypothetical protein